MKTNKSAAIRVYVEKNPGAMLSDIVSALKINRDYTAQKCRVFCLKGAFTRDEATRGYHVVPGYVVNRGGRRSADALPPKVLGNRAHLRVAKKSLRLPVVKFKFLRDVAAKHCAPAAATVTPISHARTAMAAFRETLDWDSLGSMSVMAWQSLDEAITLIGEVGGAQR